MKATLTLDEEMIARIICDWITDRVAVPGLDAFDVEVHSSEDGIIANVTFNPDTAGIEEEEKESHDL